MSYVVNESPDSPIIPICIQEISLFFASLKLLGLFDLLTG
jgi:hypothetical protein